MRIQTGLSGSWRMRQVGASEWLPATTPGCVHTDLLAAGAIPDPLVAMNELDVLWIDEVDWEYERTFTVDADACARVGQYLECDGLDTVAEIALNDQPIARTFNMFRGYRFDVAGTLRPGENVLRVVFRSPIKYGEARRAEDAFERPGSEYNWACGRVRKVYRPYVRKAQYQFGWDWGPCLATSGIWRDMRVTASDEPLIDAVTTQQRHDEGRVTVQVAAHLHAPRATAGELRVYWDGGAEPIAAQPAQLDAGPGVVRAEFIVTDPKLWQPVGYGGQHRYALRVEWVAGGKVADTRQTRVGLRDVQLVRAPDAIGESFTLRVNGQDVFCKGANWIPADSFPTRVTRQRYAALVRAAVDANMNMLRVWGGGIYEDEAFYDACDELGVLVWQDFMFACAVYPTDDAFLDEVRAEVRYQVRRLNNHPSIVLWCGDNEDEWITQEEWEGQPGYPPLMPEHDRLINQTVGPLVQAEDPGRPWWPSSPSGGPEPNSPTHGDAHWWDVWSRGKPFKAYQDVTPRFCSEFGWQSLPAWATLRTAVGSEMPSLDAPVMVHHQRQIGGNERLRVESEKCFGPAADLDVLSYYTQLTQGLALQCGVEHWRRSKPRCMGALYWQLNDCWVVASWATVDYALRYKAAHYFAKRFNAPLLGSFVDDGDALHVWLTSDLAKPQTVRYEVEAWHVDGRLLGAHQGAAELATQASRDVAAVGWSELVGAAASERETLVRLTISAGSSRHENLCVRAAYKDLTLSDPELNFVVETVGDQARVRLTCQRPALFVELDSGALPGVFSDNYFAAYPQRPIEVLFTPRDGRAADELAGELRIRSLYGRAGS